MVDRTETGLRGDEIEVGRWDVYEVEVSSLDTVTLGDYSATATLDQAHMLKKSDRSTVTCTAALNVVSVTAVGLTNVLCLLFVAGVAA